MNWQRLFALMPRSYARGYRNGWLGNQYTHGNRLYRAAYAEGRFDREYWELVNK